MGNLSVQNPVASPATRLARPLSLAATLMGATVFLVGAGHLVAWLNGYMTRQAANVLTMKTNAALCMLLTGASLILLVPRPLAGVRKLAGQSMAVLVLLIGLLTLSENLIGWDLGIDQLLAKEQPGAIAVSAPNRMGTPASLSLTLAGAALLLLGRRDRRWLKAAQRLALGVCLIALLGTVGFLYGAGQLYLIARVTGIAWPTAVSMLLLGFGLLSARPSEGMMAAITADDAGGRIIRQLLLACVGLPLLVGYLRLLGERLGLFDAAMGTGLVMLLFIVVLSFLIYQSALRLSRRETAQRAAQEALRLSEERLLLAFQAAREGIWDWDLETNAVFYSSRWKQMLGYSEAEIEPHVRAWENLLHPDDTGRARRHMDAVLRGEGDCEIEFRLRHKEGHYMHILSRSLPVRREAGGPVVRMVGTNFDLTDRKRAEEKVRESEEQFRTLADLLPHLIWVSGADGKVTYLNRQWGEYTGLGAAPYDEQIKHVHLDDRPRVTAAWDESLRTGSDFLCEYRLRRQDDQYRWVLAQAVAGRGSDGRVTGWLGSATDIHDRKQAEEILQQRVEARTAELARLNQELRREIADRKRAEEELAAARELAEQRASELEATYRTAPVGLAVLDRALHYVRINERLAEMNGVPAAAHIGRSVREVVPSIEGQALRVVRRILETGEALLNVEFRGQTAAQPGVERIWNANWFPLRDAAGQIAGINVVVEEITERKRAERELQAANEQLVARAAQLRALAGEITLVEQRERRRMAKVLHDHLQQLLVGAKFRVSILGREGNESVRKGAEEIAHLLEESINASRSLTAELSPPILHEGGLGPGLEWLARWMVDNHGLTVDLSIEEGTPNVDEDVRILLFESVRELLFNVVKHAQVRFVTLNLRPIEGKELQVTVSDNGAGFDPTKVKPGRALGRGFGLFSIQERFNLIGGRMEIHSAPGKGGRVVLTVPLRPDRTPPDHAVETRAVTTAETPVPLAPIPPGTKVRVLLADDHAVMREGLAKLLGSEPDMVVVGHAADGESAVEMARKLKPDVILMDLSMPKLSGTDATRIITAEMPQTRVIGLSMFDESEGAQTMLAAGAAAYLSKSGPSENILSAIRSCKKKTKSQQALKQGARPR